jgi:hypothetical protein
MTVEALHSQIRHLIREMPDLKAAGSSLTETHRWLGRVYALVGEAEGRGPNSSFSIIATRGNGTELLAPSGLRASSIEHWQ